MKKTAASGDVEAMTELGKWLLSGPTPEIGQAIRLLDGAAHKTGGEAAAIVRVALAGLLGVTMREGRCAGTWRLACPKRFLKVYFQLTQGRV